MSTNWDALVKAYDIRGLVDVDLTEDVVQALGAAFADELALECESLVIGHDMRDSSPRFAAAFARGATARGANVIQLGLCSTDQTYFVSGSLGLPSAMFTASHNPARYNGIKLTRSEARAISLETGLASIRDRAQAYLEQGISPVALVGGVSEYDSLTEYASYLRSMVNLDSIRPLRVVIDAANGMAGHSALAVLGESAGLAALPIEILPLYFELDGNFPNHEANPLVAENLRDLQAAVVAQKADLGLAFDGDADRCFVVDELGNPVSPSTVAAIVARVEIDRAKALGEQNVTVLYGHLASRMLADSIRSAGARASKTKVGHSLIKAQMLSENAVFGAEHSAHYYFRDFWFADSGLLAAMHFMKALGESQGSASELAHEFAPYPGSGEINLQVADVAQALERVKTAFGAGAVIDEFDGVTFGSSAWALGRASEAPSAASSDPEWWWFNLRSSNTEPLLRFNAEAASQAQLEKIIAGVLAVIQS